MTHWNHRIVRHRNNSYQTDDLLTHPEYWYGVHEVFYSDLGKIEGFTEQPVQPYGETADEIIRELDMFQVAARKPVLDYDTKEEIIPSKFHKWTDIKRKRKEKIEREVSEKKTNSIPEDGLE